MIAGDIFLIYLSLFLTLAIRHGNFEFLGGAEFNQLLYHFSVLAPLWILFLFIFDFYEPRISADKDFARNIIGLVIAIFISGIAYFYFKSSAGIAPKTILLFYTAIFTIFILIFRSALFIVSPIKDGSEIKIVYLEKLQEDLFLESFAKKRNKTGYLAKRTIDLIFGAIGLIILGLFFIPVASLIKFTSSGKIFYTQKRLGKGGKIFALYKFRTMVEDAEKEGPRWAGKIDERVTVAGYILRRLHLDELPQAINILKGDISLVGPRPERPEFTAMLEKEIPHYKLRLLTQPGVLGWAQLNFPYGDSVEDAREKLKYDLYYIQNMSVLLDLSIILKSIKIVLFAKGQ